jgi:uncharacterized protein with FMN-binding domain
MKTPAIALGALSIVGALAGCATSGQSSAPYKDGTYTESATYQAPDGSEQIDVTVTLENDTITAVSVVSHGTGGPSESYQSEFADGISGAVVGKDIDSISVDKVGGSSLTSGGFSKAIEAIKTDAQS